MTKTPPQTSGELIAEIEQTRQLALGYSRSYVNKSGEVASVPAPDFRAALNASRLKGELLGYLGNGENMSLETLKRELADLGYKLVPLDDGAASSSRDPAAQIRALPAPNPRRLKP